MVTVEITSRFRQVPADSTKLKKLVRAVCRRFRVSQAAVSVGIVGDTDMSTLNKEFLNHEGPTDCLSFDLSDEATAGNAKVFDLIVNGELAAREANRRGHSGQAELALYVVHGLLHNLGFDDATAAQAREMHQTEDEILQELGYGLVYNSGLRAQ